MMCQITSSSIQGCWLLPWFLTVSFMSPRAWNAVRGVAIGRKGQHEKCGVRLTSKATGYELLWFWPWDRTPATDWTDVLLLMVWIRQIQRLVGRRSLGCREKSDQFLVVNCSYREGQCVLNIRAFPRAALRLASWILGGCLWILVDLWYLRPYIATMTNLDRFGKTKTSKPLFDHQCFKASAKLNKVMWRSLWFEFMVSSLIFLWERVFHLLCVPRTFLCFYLTVTTQYLLLGLI